MLCDMCAVVPLGVKCMNYEHFSQIHVHIAHSVSKGSVRVR